MKCYSQVLTVRLDLHCAVWLIVLFFHLFLPVVCSILNNISPLCNLCVCVCVCCACSYILFSSLLSFLTVVLITTAFLRGASDLGMQLTAFSIAKRLDQLNHPRTNSVYMLLLRSLAPYDISVSNSLFLFLSLFDSIRSDKGLSRNVSTC